MLSASIEFSCPVKGELQCLIRCVKGSDYVRRNDLMETQVTTADAFFSPSIGRRNKLPDSQNVHRQTTIGIKYENHRYQDDVYR